VGGGSGRGRQPTGPRWVVQAALPLLMDADSTNRTPVPSTNWTWRKVRMWESPTPPQQTSAPKAPTTRLKGRSRNAPITIEVTYRGGSQCWYRIRARGQLFSIPGDRAIHDVMEYINSAHTAWRVADEDPGRHRHPSGGIDGGTVPGGP
jgi:hypothetical protein